MLLRSVLRSPTAAAAALGRRRLLATVPGAAGKPRVVILGTGWGGYRLAQTIDKKKYDVRIVSPSNHFLFTPYLPQTAVGTLEFRVVQEPIRTIPGACSPTAKPSIGHCRPPASLLRLRRFTAAPPRPPTIPSSSHCWSPTPVTSTHPLRAPAHPSAHHMHSPLPVHHPHLPTHTHPQKRN